jgi:hypothetical protein
LNQFGDAYKKLEALGDRERVLAVWPDYERCEGCGNAISKGPQGWVHEDSDQMGCERAVPKPPQPAKPEALVTDQEIATRLRDSGDTCMCIDCRFARELQAWRAWAKSGESR